MDSDRFQKILRGNYGEAIRGFNSFENIAMLLTEGCFRGYDAYGFASLYSTLTEEDVRRFIEENLTEERCALSMILPMEDEV